MTIIHKTVVFLALLLAGIHTGAAQRRLTAEEYIEKHKRLAIIEQDIYGIPASIKLGQALLESDCGNSRLALLGNNHFGIKCKREWTGETILHDDDAPQECFRKYTSTEDSFRDHSEFLDKSPRYQQLFTLDPTDYKGWAGGLKECGYATNPKYAEILIGLIERHQLYLLDMEDPGSAVVVAMAEEESADNISGADPYVGSKVDVDNYTVSVNMAGNHAIFLNNGSEFVVARPGETYEQIAGMTGVPVKKLRKFNDAGAQYQPFGGEQVYIRNKAARSTNGKLMHVAKKGETLRYVSQMYGIRLNKLARFNRMDGDEPLREGQQIRLM